MAVSSAVRSALPPIVASPSRANPSKRSMACAIGCCALLVDELWPPSRARSANKGASEPWRAASARKLSPVAAGLPVTVTVRFAMRPVPSASTRMGVPLGGLAAPSGMGKVAASCAARVPVVEDGRVSCTGKPPLAPWPGELCALATEPFKGLPSVCSRVSRACALTC